MTGYNRVIIAGNLTRDPEVRFTSNGTTIASGGLAINRKFNSGGEQKSETTFVDWKAFQASAELAGDYLKKGDAVLIEGRLTLDQWEDRKSGDKRSKLTVTVEHLTFLPKGPADSGPSDRPEPRSKPPTRQEPNRSRQAPQKPPPEPDQDDVPY